MVGCPCGANLLTRGVDAVLTGDGQEPHPEVITIRHGDGYRGWEENAPFDVIIAADNSAAMLDVALRGVGNRWDDVVIPGLDYLLVEKTLGKYGPRVEVLNALPINMQHLVGVAHHA